MQRERIIEVDAGSPLWTEVFGLRCEVFVVEQGVPHEIELDEHDATATHPRRPRRIARHRFSRRDGGLRAKGSDD